MSQFSDHNFSGEKALVRVDFNVPLDKQTFAITDDNRMRATIPTIKKILADGGSAILMSHLGRPKDGPEDKSSLKHLVKHLSDLLGGAKVFFANDCIGEQAYLTASMLRGGEVLLLENLRFYKEEEKGETKDFAKKLSEAGRCLYKRCFWNSTQGTCFHRRNCESILPCRQERCLVC